jgi:hypothetical protein
VSIRGRVEFDIGVVVQQMLNHYPKCKIKHKTLALATTESFAKILTRQIGKSRSDFTKAFRKHPINLTDSPYLSIVVACRNDDDFCQDFVYSVGRAVKVVPLADVELIVVGFGNGSLASVIQVPATIANKVRFIEIPAAVADVVRKPFNTS